MINLILFLLLLKIMSAAARSISSGGRLLYMVSILFGACRLSAVFGACRLSDAVFGTLFYLVYDALMTRYLDFCNLTKNNFAYLGFF